MTVEVEWTTRARAELVRLLTGMSDSVEDAIRFAGLFLDDIDAEFVARDGEIPDAVHARQPGGPEWWWRYVNGVWVGYTFRDRRAWMFGATTRTVRVQAVGASPNPR